MKLPAEVSHRVAVRGVRYGGLRDTPTQEEKAGMLEVRIVGRRSGKVLKFKNCVGLAAGFDKDGEAIQPMLAAGFGSVEIGSVTPKPQPGNPKPRVFRLEEDKAVINRYGFNSSGLEQARANVVAGLEELERYKAEGLNVEGVVGVNLGKNKLTKEASEDYRLGIKGFFKVEEECGRNVDYITVNVSSPNTPGLRDLQEKDKLESLLRNCIEQMEDCWKGREKDAPLLFLKVSPDLDQQQIKDIADVVLSTQVDGIIVSNTTNSRPEHLKNSNKVESGGLSGSPLGDASNRAIKEMYSHLKGKVPIIGVGGVSSWSDAYSKILSGCCMVQLYTGMVYQGMGLASDIKSGIIKKLEKEGMKHVSEAVGKGE